MEQWLWAERTTSNRRKPRGSDCDVPSFVVTYPYPSKNISLKSRAVPYTLANGLAECGSSCYFRAFSNDTERLGRVHANFFLLRLWK